MELFGAERAVLQARSLLNAFRQRGLSVFHVQHLAEEPGATFFVPGTPGVDIHPAVLPLPAEPVVTKHFPNAFRETALLGSLRAANASKLVIAGMMTHMCVDTSVRAATDLGFDCVLAHDACATLALEFQGIRVPAQQVQLAYLAALADGFAVVQDTQAVLDNLSAI